QPFGRRLVLLQAYQRDGEAMVGGVCPAAVVPGLGHVARRRRVGLGEAQAALVHLGVGIVGFRRRRAQRLRLRPERRQRRAERIVGTGRAGGRAERRGEGEGKHRAPPLRPTLARHYHEGSSRPLIGVCVHWLWSACAARLAGFTTSPAPSPTAIIASTPPATASRWSAPGCSASRSAG